MQRRAVAAHAAADDEQVIVVLAGAGGCCGAAVLGRRRRDARRRPGVWVSQLWRCWIRADRSGPHKPGKAGGAGAATRRAPVFKRSPARRGASGAAGGLGGGSDPLARNARLAGQARGLSGPARRKLLAGAAHGDLHRVLACSGRSGPVTNEVSSAGRAAGGGHLVGQLR